MTHQVKFLSALLLILFLSTTGVAGAQEVVYVTYEDLGVTEQQFYDAAVHCIVQVVWVHGHYTEDVVDRCYDIIIRHFLGVEQKYKFLASLVYPD